MTSMLVVLPWWLLQVKVLVFQINPLWHQNAPFRVTEDFMQLFLQADATGKIRFDQNMNLNHVLQEEQSNYFTGVTNESRHVRKHIQTNWMSQMLSFSSGEADKHGQTHTINQINPDLNLPFQKYLLFFEYIVWKSAGITCCYMPGTILSGLIPGPC